MTECKKAVMEKGLIFDIHRGTTHDGPGMRTTVFFKGCPLNCRWCQNPESIRPYRELQWDAGDCIGCKSCIAACPNGVLHEEQGRLVTDDGLCRRCFTCEEICPSGAMSAIGEYREAEELAEEACRDRMFFDEFGGGVTISGGEPLLQAEFLLKLLKELKKKGVHTAVDTSGFGSRESLEQIFPYVDTFLYDMKLMDDVLHRQYTGVSNRRILENLVFLADKIQKQERATLWIRTPLIPETTATVENLERTGRFIREEIYPAVERWELCAFNQVCRDKYRKLGLGWDYAGYGLMGKTQMAGLTETAARYAGEKLVISGLTAKEE